MAAGVTDGWDMSDVVSILEAFDARDQGAGRK